ncbi:PEST proteolytic signal-containing nuclear protein isoform X3 [Dendrobates tinctorius]|uniref:PEST proteolytic signal-containing nuclear protein isoform X3 n=1 Tax=Dendrobates tinctorius TaxID=92724 RepID=UPI003CCA637A
MADKKELQGGPEEDAESTVTTKPVSSSNGGESSGRGAEKRSAVASAEEEAGSQPCPSKVAKFGFAFGGQTAKKPPSISIKLGSAKPKETPPAAVPKKTSVAAAFNDEDDSEPEEMPPEAKMRMKNIGRFLSRITPTLELSTTTYQTLTYHRNLQKEPEDPPLPTSL